MTGFDETVPPENDADRDATAVPGPDPAAQRPEHDSTAPAVEDEPGPDEPDEPDEPGEMAGDDDLRAGQIGPDGTR